MDLSKFVAVSGVSGIYLVGINRNNGLILEDIETGKKHFFSSRKHQFSPLESISVYTTHTETTDLKTVFEQMLAHFDTHPPVSPQATDGELTAYFAQILPTYDRYRVKLSDIKKIVRWFTFLHGRGLLTASPEAKNE